MKNNEFDIFKLFYILKKRFALFILTAIVVSTAFFVKFHILYEPIFISQYNVYSTVLESKVLTEEINGLQKLKELKNFESIASKLDLSINSAKSIKLFSAKDLSDLQKRMVTVNISGKDSSVLYKMPHLLEDMIAKTPLYQNTAENYMEFLAYEKEKIESELENTLSITPGTNLNISIRGTGELLDRKLKNSENIKNFRLLGIVGENNITRIEASLKFNIIAAILGGIAAGLFFILMIEFALFVKNRVNQYED